MRITVKCTLGQLFLLLGLFALCNCTAKKEESLIAPPPTSPLSRDYIGFGVITSSFTHVTAEPAEDSPSLGYLRRGSLVRVIRRQAVKTGGSFVSWVLTDGDGGKPAAGDPAAGDPAAGEPAAGSPAVRGWLKEEVMEIFESESQAKTAANLRFEESSSGLGTGR